MVLPVRGGGDDQGPLPLAQRREQVHDAGGHGLGAGLQAEPEFGVDGGEDVEGLDVLIVLGGHAVDVEDFAEAGALLAASGLDHAADEHPLAQPELVDHAAGNERIGQLADVVVLGIAEEAVAVGVQFEDAAARLDGARLAVVDGFLVAGRIAVGGRSHGSGAVAVAAA